MSLMKHADPQIGGGFNPQSVVSSIGNALSPAMQQIGEKATQIGNGAADLATKYPRTAALLGLGTAGAGGYALARLTGGKKREGTKLASDLSARRQEFVKEARETMRYNAAVILQHYLTKLASASSSDARRALTTLQSRVLSGDSVGVAVQRTFPKLASDRQQQLAGRLVNEAWQLFCKQACFPGCNTKPMKTSSPSSFHGKPHEAHAWMKKEGAT